MYMRNIIMICSKSTNGYHSSNMWLIMLSGWLMNIRGVATR